ncbi:MAG: ATP-binding cassette domain-containing protein [Bacteroidales bacterium]|jgi:ABC-type multidrug transport system ATPase subunit|nr:ATP-binding cassette domain-containing protein [Bacteroidales bacterium]
MRDSVLLALIHIFAIISTVKPGSVSARGRKILRSYLRRYLNRELEEKYFEMFESNLAFYASELKSIDEEDLFDDKSLITFQITNICRQIKKGLLLDERMIVFLQLLEFAFEDRVVTSQERIIIEIVARTFNIPPIEFENAFAFMIGGEFDKVVPEHILVIEGDADRVNEKKLPFSNYDKWNHMKLKGFSGNLYVLYIESTGSLLMTYEGSQELYFMGRDIIPYRAYLLERGVNIKGPGIEPIYYSKVFKSFLTGKMKHRVVFEGHGLEFRFRGSEMGLRRLNFSVESGNLIGIMGGSGVGKTTLLKVLNGKFKPSAGNVYLNGYDLHNENEALAGLIGYVPQDDMLIEELTAYQNLYYNARLCFGDFSEEQLRDTVDKVLSDLELSEIRDLQVGDILNKKVSGGQRKRLNIGLELMREPAVLFVDEPTSGLSSHDSERVMMLLKNLAMKGKLVFTIIHQPSSGVIKMFDRLWLLDKGGFMIYDGDPVDALVYFKTEVSQANAAESECPNCGNVETDSILQIVEAKVIDNEGYPGKNRQVQPEEWYARYCDKMQVIPPPDPPRQPLPPSNFRIPGRISQVATFVRRNFTRKRADRQYMIINLLEAPLLAFVLGYFSKFSAEESYVFSENKNFLIFLFMSVVVAVFMGLTVSAEEIFRDRKVIERERYLNISRLSYLVSKISFLFILSAAQTLSYVIVANAILEVHGMLFRHWLILFSAACYGNMLGLNISAGMRSAISIYILIPLILVPQLLFGGAMIRFDDLHKSISNRVYVPVIGDVMATRWAYEALMVEQFRSNRYQKHFFEAEMAVSRNDWYASFLLPTLKVKIEECRIAGKREEYREHAERNFRQLNYHFRELSAATGIAAGDWITRLNREQFDENTAAIAIKHADSLRIWYRKQWADCIEKRDDLVNDIVARNGMEALIAMKNKHHNDNIADFVLNRNFVDKIYETDYMILQKADPVYMEPGSRYGRAHFYAPHKRIGRFDIGTLLFNTIALWIMCLLLFVTLYCNILRKAIDLTESFHIPVFRKFTAHLLP